MFEATLCVRSGVILSDYFFIMFSVFNNFLKHNFLLLFPCTGNFFLQLDKIEPFEKKLKNFRPTRFCRQEIRKPGNKKIVALLTLSDFRTDISVSVQTLRSKYGAFTGV